MAELHIPDAAFDALVTSMGEHDLSGPAGTEQWLRVLAAPVVAAELRRLAEEFRGFADRPTVSSVARRMAWVDAADDLTDRAAELAPAAPVPSGGGDRGAPSAWGGEPT